MKKNTIKFWLANRFTMLFCLWVVIFVILGIIGNPYLNAFMLVLMLFCSLGVWSSLIEYKNANASERLMWQKYSKFIDSIKN